MSNKPPNRPDEPSSSTIVKVADLRKTYRMGRVDLTVLKGVSFEIAAGEFATIYGHSGSGKSTLLHLIGLLDKATGGDVFFESLRVGGLSAGLRNQIRCRDIGFVFQFYYLLPELNVLENTLLPAMVDTPLLAWVARRKALRSRAADLLDELGLGDRLKHRPGELSGGERQRVAIARALINRPKLLLADEPTGNLDSRTGQKIMDVLLRYNREHGQTTIMVTHDEELAGLVSRSLTLKDGRLVK
jgi:lipoprotein-releasing system ATP-binding protein